MFEAASASSSANVVKTMEDPVLDVGPFYAWVYRGHSANGGHSVWGR